MPDAPKLTRRALAGIASFLCGLFVACGGGGGKAVVEGDAAKVEMVLHHGAPFINNLQAASDKVAERVYEVAKAHPQAKKVEVTLKMSKDGMEDGYGKPWTEDRAMGTLAVTDLDEVRKFTDAGHYAINPRVRENLMAQIGEMKYAEQLKK